MFDMDSTCRTCMKTGEAVVDLFDPWKTEDDNSFQLREALETCTATQISKEDGLPQKLCGECVKALQFIYAFRLQVLNSYEEFKKGIEAEANVKDEQIDLDLKTENSFEYDFSYEDFFFDNFPKDESEDKTYECNECKKQFTNESRFQKHLKTHEKLSLNCNVCEKSFHKQSSFQRHLAKHYQCTICLNHFESEELLVEHMNGHVDDVEIKTLSDNIVFKCTECDAVYNKHRSLAMHMKKHKHERGNSDDKKFECQVCQKEFGLKTLLRRHMKLHSEERPYQCHKCSKSYSRHDQYTEHMKKHNGVKSNVCPHCDKAFSQLCSLKDHIRTHTGETPYLCSECGKGFNNSSNLRQHMLRHTGLKPYACSLCPKRFTTKGQMTCHVSTHSGAHPHKCETCGAAFTKPNSLKKHRLIHLGVKPFACDTCPMRFSCKDHLKRHYRIHTGEKPYRCQHCERAFTQSNDLAKHTRAHLGQNIYQCTQCDMRFRLLSELKQHYPTHYVDGEPTVTPADKVESAADEAVCKDEYVLKPGEKEQNGTITITFTRNGLEKDGVHGNITIDITPQST